MFDVMVKRCTSTSASICRCSTFSSYKRMQRDPIMEMTPRTLSLAEGRARLPQAQLFINSSTRWRVRSSDPLRARSASKSSFSRTISVKLGQSVYPAADLSEQIWLAGKEASGTGNMNFAMNGASPSERLMAPTSKFERRLAKTTSSSFGLTAAEVEQKKSKGYNPRAIYQREPALKNVLDSLASGEFSHGVAPSLNRSLIPCSTGRVHAAGRLSVVYRLPGPRQVVTRTRTPGQKCPFSMSPASASSPPTAPFATIAPIWKTSPVKIQL